MAEHVDLTDPNLHEPKGAAAASANTVYIADGAGSGAWDKVATAQLDYADVLASIQTDVDDGDLELTGVFFMTVVLNDVSAASDILVPVIDDCTLVSASLVLGGAITVANASVTFTNSAAASMGGAVTITQAGSAEGTTFSFTASGNNVFTGPTWFKIATDGGSTDTQPLYITLKFSAVLNA